MRVYVFAVDQVQVLVIPLWQKSAFAMRTTRAPQMTPTRSRWHNAQSHSVAGCFQGRRVWEQAAQPCVTVVVCRSLPPSHTGSRYMHARNRWQVYCHPPAKCFPSGSPLNCHCAEESRPRGVKMKGPVSAVTAMCWNHPLATIAQWKRLCRVLQLPALLPEDSRKFGKTSTVYFVLCKNQSVCV